MKTLIFLLLTCSFQFAFGAQAITGFLGKNATGYYLISQNSKIRYALISQNEDVAASLQRLAKGDFVTGQGSLDTVNKKIKLENIDYVGLRKLLGTWVGGDGVMVFKDFSRMKFSPRFTQSGMNVPFNSSYQKEFRYTISPSDGDEWALFLSDDQSTSYATVEFDKKKFTMKIYESESGNIVRTLKLERP